MPDPDPALTAAALATPDDEEVGGILTGARIHRLARARLPSPNTELTCRGRLQELLAARDRDGGPGSRAATCSALVHWLSIPEPGHEWLLFPELVFAVPPPLVPGSHPEHPRVQRPPEHQFRYLDLLAHDRDRDGLAEHQPDVIPLLRLLEFVGLVQALVVARFQ